MTTDSKPLWQPSAERIANANITRFIEFANRERGANLTDFDSLYDWSVTELETFWDAVWDFSGIVGDKGSDVILKDGDKMPGAAFFPDAKVNFAENLLRRRDDADAIVFWGEDKVKRRLSFAELYDEVSKFAQALKAEGVGPGDRVAAFMPNMPETIAAMLATAPPARNAAAMVVLKFFIIVSRLSLGFRFSAAAPARWWPVAPPSARRRPCAP